MGKLIIDAHSHLWLKQDTTVDGKRILSLKNGRSIFMDEEVQMLPPFMIDGQNTAEVFLSNMNYAQVGAAVVVQEVIDGCQNDYLADVQRRYPDRFFCMGMAWNIDEAQQVMDAGLKGIAYPGHRMHEPLQTLMPIFKLMGIDYQNLNIYSRMENGVDIYTRGVFRYPRATCSFKVGLGVKTEGSLVISGTKGYAYVPAPWWKTDYFEIRYEDQNLNKKFFYPYEGEGLRYEVKDFISSILTKGYYYSKISPNEHIAMAKVQEKYLNKEKLFTI